MFVVLQYGKNKKDPKFIVYYDVLIGVVILVYGYTYVVMMKQIINWSIEEYGSDPLFTAY